MKIWLDDIRNPPDDTWFVCRNGLEFKRKIMFADVFITHMSLDHDLGEESLNGHELCNWIERHIYLGNVRFPVLESIVVHSANPVGRSNMERAIKQIIRLNDSLNRLR